MPDAGHVSAVALTESTSHLEAIRSIMHDPVMRAGSRSARAVVYIVLAAGGEMDVPQIADITRLESSHVARCCQWLCDQGLAVTPSDGVFACMHAVSLSNKSLSVRELTTTNVGGGLVIRDATRAELSPVRTLLRWTPGPLLAASDWLEPAVRLCELMGQQLEDRSVRAGAVASAHNRAWVVPMEALLRLDLAPQDHPRTPPERVAATLGWLHTAPDEVAQFWQTVVLSPANLRKHWPKMAAQLAGLRRRQVGGRSSGLAQASGADQVIAQALRDRGITNG